MNQQAEKHRLQTRLLCSWLNLQLAAANENNQQHICMPVTGPTVHLHTGREIKTI